MIIKIKYGQPRLKVRLVQPGGGRRLDYKQVRLFIREPDLLQGCERNTSWKLEGCWPTWRGPMDTTPPPKPALVYPAFGLDDETGVIVFQLDGKLDAWEPGRYIGSIVTGEGVVLDTLDIDLHNSPFIVDAVDMLEEVSCDA